MRTEFFELERVVMKLDMGQYSYSYMVLRQVGQSVSVENCYLQASFRFEGKLKEVILPGKRDPSHLHREVKNPERCKCQTH